MESQQRKREKEKLSDMNCLKESWAISWTHKYRQICMFLIDNEVPQVNPDYQMVQLTIAVGIYFSQ